MNCSLFSAKVTFYNLIRFALTLVLTGFLWFLATAKTSAGQSSSENAEDQFRLGRSYYWGEGVNQSFEQAGIWYRKAAEQGNLKAMYNLGVMFLQGQGTVKNEVEGFKWIRQAAEGGDPRASYVYGVLLCEGKGVVKNAREGHSWLTKASEMGSVNAEARIGKDYLYGGDGFTAEPTKALPLIEKASESGNPWACGRLGEILEKGELLPKDLEKSRSLFQKGAELGDPASQFEYARLLMMSDPVKAYPWIKLAEEGHDTRAIGLMTECRPGLTPDQVASGDAMAEKIRKTYQQMPSPGK